MIKKLIEFVMETLESIVFMGSLFIVVYLFIAQPNEVRGASMEPNLKTGDRLITSKVSYKFETIKRGDIVVIHSPKNYEIQYIKRIIGLPDDTILLSGGNVYVNGEKLEETYLTAETHAWENWSIKEDELFIVPREHVVVMGDNRSNSSDSREFGAVNIDSIVGKAIYRYFPLQKIGRLENPFRVN